MNKLTIDHDGILCYAAAFCIFNYKSCISRYANMETDKEIIDAMIAEIGYEEAISQAVELACIRNELVIAKYLILRMHPIQPTTDCCIEVAKNGSPELIAMIGVMGMSTTAIHFTMKYAVIYNSILIVREMVSKLKLISLNADNVESYLTLALFHHNFKMTIELLVLAFPTEHNDNVIIIGVCKGCIDACMPITSVGILLDKFPVSNRHLLHLEFYAYAQNSPVVARDVASRIT